MEAKTKKRLSTSLIIIAGLLYFFICAVPLSKTMVLEPVWAKDMALAPEKPAAAAAPGASVIPFRSGDRFGYFSAAGDILFCAPLSYDVALADDAFAEYERLSEGFSVRAPSGMELCKAAIPGYPFFSSGRRFVMAPDQASVSELAGDGKPLWSYSFSSIVTAFGAAPSLAVFGLMDGRLIGIDRDGQTRLDFAPGGSRIAGVYGLALSRDGSLVAAICGLDRQRLVVLERRDTAYRVCYHRWLDSETRRPVNMGFVRDGGRMLYESHDGVGVYDRATKSESLLRLRSSATLGLDLQGTGLLIFLAEAGSEKRLVCASASDCRAFDLPLSAADPFLAVDGRSFFLGLDGHLLRLDIREE